MKINKFIFTAIILLGLLLGGLGAGVLLSQQPQSANAAPSTQDTAACADDDNVEHEAEGNFDEDDDGDEVDKCADNEADEENEADESNEVDETDETTASPDQMGITPEEAQAAAEAANPGTKTLAVEIDHMDENGGALIYEVELDNGIDVKVDGNDGTILGTDVRDAN
ncbi:MAG: PepSY domain-containing protein [Anaerolineae bacterium]|nr:PepSY domain-containing protein [Anaerolineae bacterium]